MAEDAYFERLCSLAWEAYFVELTKQPEWAKIKHTNWGSVDQGTKAAWRAAIRAAIDEA